MLTIRLLGRPWIEGDGRRLPSPRGRKAWALLAYLLLTDRPLSRVELGVGFGGPVYGGATARSRSI